MRTKPAFMLRWRSAVDLQSCWGRRSARASAPPRCTLFVFSSPWGRDSDIMHHSVHKNSFVAAQNKPKHLIRRPEFADVGSFVPMARVEKLSPDISGWFRVWHVCPGWGGRCAGLPWWPPRSRRTLLLFFILRQIARRQSFSPLFTSTIRTKTVITLRL